MAVIKIPKQYLVGQDADSITIERKAAAIESAKSRQLPLDLAS